MKKLSSIFTIILMVPVFLVGCASQNKNDFVNNKSQSVKSSKKNLSKKSMKKNTNLWNDQKNKQLADYMQVFGKAMKQNYKSYGPTNNVDFYGVKFPDFFAENKIKVANQHVTVAWSSQGEKMADYSVVAIYSDIESGTQTFNNHLYLFAIKDDKPVVLITQQNQGMPDNMIHFELTKNTELSSNFTKIIAIK